MNKVVFFGAAELSHKLATNIGATTAPTQSPKTWDWPIDTKYYTAKTTVVCLEEGETETQCWDETQALAFVCDHHTASTLNKEHEVCGFIGGIDVPVKLLFVWGSQENISGLDGLMEWCSDEFVELIFSENASSEAEDGPFAEKFGVDRVVQALHSHMWPEMTMKPRNAAATTATATATTTATTTAATTTPATPATTTQPLANTEPTKPSPPKQPVASQQTSEQTQNAAAKKLKKKKRGKKVTKGQTTEQTQPTPTTTPSTTTTQTKTTTSTTTDQTNKQTPAQQQKQQTKKQSKKNKAKPPNDEDDDDLDVDELQSIMELVSQVRAFRQANPNSLKEAHSRAEDVMKKLAVLAGLDDDGDADDDVVA